MLASYNILVVVDVIPCDFASITKCLEVVHGCSDADQWRRRWCRVVAGLSVGMQWRVVLGAAVAEELLGK